MARRAIQFLFGLITTISVFASPVIACACDHHKPVEQPPASCHSKAAAETSHHAESSAGEHAVNGFSDHDNCVCIQPTPKAFAKSEGLKLKKQVSAISSLPEPEESPELVSPSTTDNFPGVDTLIRRPLFRSEPSRGPPAL